MADPQGFKTGPSYRHLMGGTQRNSPPQIGTPAVTQHLAFRKPIKDRRLTEAEKKNFAKKEMPSGRDLWVWDVERLILQFYDRLNTKASKLKIELQKDKPLTPNLQERAGDKKSRLYLFDNSYDGELLDRFAAKPVDEPDRYPAVRFIFLWQSMPVEVSFQLYTEYFTITSTIDLSQWNPAKTPARRQGSASRELRQAVEAFNDAASDRYRQVIQKKKPIERHQSQEFFKGDHKGLYHEIYYSTWERFYKVMFAGLEASRPNRIGEHFADFRNLVISRRKDANSQDFIVLPGQASGDPPTDILIREPFEREETAARLETLIPFMRVAEFLKTDEPTKTGEVPPVPMEYTATRFLDGLVLHLSSLGAPPPVVQLEGTTPRAHTDLLYAVHDDPWQLGRLIETGNILGTLRVAALFDQPKIEEANDGLLRLEKGLEEISEKLPRTLPVLKEKRKPSAKPSVLIEEVAEDLLRKSRELARANDSVPGSLAERAAISRGYRQDFDRLAALLREERIEGWQPYLSFLVRRMGDTYSRIDEIGTRYEHLKKTVEEQGQELRTVELLQLQQAISEQVTASTEQQRRVRILQESAGVLALAVAPAAAIEILNSAASVFASEETIKNSISIKGGVFLGAVVAAIITGKILTRREKREELTETADKGEKRMPKRFLNWLGKIQIPEGTLPPAP